jgi:MFS family permease
MARPALPAKRPASAGAKSSAAAKQGKTRAGRRRGGGGDTLMLAVSGGAVLFLGIMALPVCILLLAGMAPTIVAYIVDQTPRRTLTLTVGPLNLTGTAPYCLQLWFGADTLHALGAYLTDVYIWLVMYLAAAIGWLLHLGMPLIVRLILEQSIERRKNKLLQIQKRLRAEWGDGVDGTGDTARRES